MARRRNNAHFLKPNVDGYFAIVSCPASAVSAAKLEVLATHLAFELDRLDLGRVTGCTPARANTDETTSTIALSLISDGAEILRMVADLLCRLEAPQGSTLGHAECPHLITVPQAMPHSWPKRRAARSARALRGSFGLADSDGVIFFAAHAHRLGEVLAKNRDPAHLASAARRPTLH